ncbi:carboxypeptidase-like regulatory domain-containing protein [Microbispora siamensis]
MERRAALGVLLTAALSGCGILGTLSGCGILEEGQVSGSVREERSGRGGELGEVEPGVLKGRVVDAQGRPIEGAEIVADNQLLYNSNEVVRTGGDGLYRVATDVRATFHASGTVIRRYNGQEYTLSLAPDDDAPFAGPSGAIRNFTWRLTGKKPDDLGFYGGKVLFRLDLNDQINAGAFLDDEKVRLTLTPDGPLIDGLTGNPDRATGDPERGRLGPGGRPHRPLPDRGRLRGPPSQGEAPQRRRLRGGGRRRIHPSHDRHLLDRVGARAPTGVMRAGRRRS